MTSQSEPISSASFGSWLRPIYHAVVLAELAVAAGFLRTAAALILGRSRDDRPGAYVAAVPALGLGALGYVTFAWLNGLTAGI